MKLIYLVVATMPDDFVICGATADKQRAKDIKEAAEKIYTEDDYWEVEISTYTDGVFY